VVPGDLEDRGQLAAGAGGRAVLQGLGEAGLPEEGASRGVGLAEPVAEDEQAVAGGEGELEDLVAAPGGDPEGEVEAVDVRDVEALEGSAGPQEQGCRVARQDHPASALAGGQVDEGGGHESPGALEARLHGAGEPAGQLGEGGESGSAGALVRVQDPPEVLEGGGGGAAAPDRVRDEDP